MIAQRTNDPARDVSDDELIARLDAIDEAAMYDAPATTKATVSEAAARLRSHSESKREMAWREITEDDRPPNDTPVLMGCWESWPRQEWIVELDLYGSTRGGWVHGRMTHWMPADFLFIAPPARAVIAKEAGHAE